VKKLILFGFLFLLFGNLNAQQSAKNIKPILLDKSALSGVGLKKIDLKDEPEKDFYQKNLYWGKDLGVFVVSTENWNNEIENYPFDEFVYMYQGEALVKPKVGSNQVFYSGDYFFAPKGFVGEWEISAGNNLHYELSVITTTRADSTIISDNPQHKLFKRSVLSGNNITLDEEGQYSSVLQKGDEITVELKAEAPGERSFENDTEQLIHVLSGQIKITDSIGQELQFHTGDFFVLPLGCSGIWMSEGHQMIKYLSVKKTNLTS